jgi:uncharacterized protein (DUF1697 family)
MASLSRTTWVVLLRGINVGGNKRVAMAGLRDLLGSLGYEDVRTVLQSGNAILTTGKITAAALQAEIESGITRQFGLDVKVIALTAAELAASVDANPFAAGGAAAKELHVAFLSASAPEGKIAAIDREALTPDEFEVGNRVLYLRLANGITGSRLPNWERLLGLTVTVRNWNTVSKLLALTS